MKRREFLKATPCLALFGPRALPEICRDLDALEIPPQLSKVEARYYQKLPDKEIECQLCPRQCRLGNKERGYCGVRENSEGTYYTLVYGKACSVHVDPIEKKPFFHFYPGQITLSLATAGCNVNCKFCQNWEISQVRPEQVHHFDFPPRMVVDTAKKYDCPIIAYTYTEPVVFYEYMVDTAKLGRRAGLKSVVVTGGHINPEPLEELISVVEAIKVDLKSFTQDFYDQYVRGKLQPVLEAIKKIAASPIWLEIVYLVIPTLNDSVKEIKNLSRWIKAEVGPDVPLHFSRFHPMYLLRNLPPTPISTLERAHQIAREEGLNYVYIGNVPGHQAESTYCPRCGTLLIKRWGFEVSKINLKDGKCPQCQTPIPGIWD
ncbi:MAG TPA: AmmeMemoRadiSam system radical SAM enzyme [Candidatus Aminicenantes bacterium]|nr:AmmeMemoRadiSam system radical SAM enzyme [Candidatus Aminicenantes bacterium]